MKTFITTIAVMFCLLATAQKKDSTLQADTAIQLTMSKAEFQEVLKFFDNLPINHQEVKKITSFFYDRARLVKVPKQKQ